MKDAGQSLRQYFKKTTLEPVLLVKPILEYAAMQRSTENQPELFIEFGVPDWRLNNLPRLYDELINKADLLKAEGLSDEEIHCLQKLSAHFSFQCNKLISYNIPAALGIPDFNTNNVVIDLDTKQLTFIDLGEAVITHPFFSLQNYLHQAVIHHGVQEHDEIYKELQEACFKNWLEVTTKDQLVEAFLLSKKIWPIYSALSTYRLINIIGFEAFQSFYADRPHRIRSDLRDYIAWNII
jgi:hypothetical protein